MARIRSPRTGRFTANPRGFSPFTNSLTPGIIAYEAALIATINDVMREYAKEMEDYMKANAPWEDRTGDARDGLTAVMEEDPIRPTIHLYHTVSYGLWLEIRWNGLYAIIMPTIEDMGPGLIQVLDGAI